MLVTFPYNPYLYLQKAFSLKFLKTVVAFCVCYATSALAHPHIFIDLKVSANNDKVTITWAFDAMTSAMLIGDYDKNKLPETATVEKNGGEVRILSFVEGKSTTNIVKKIQFKDGGNDEKDTNI